MTYAKENTKMKAGIRARALGMARARVALVAVATLASTIPASAQNPFAFLFGGSPAPQARQAPPSEARWFPAPDPRSTAMREGRSAYAPGLDRGAGLSGYRDGSHSRAFRPRPHAVSLEPVHSSKSPKDVMAAIEAAKPGRGPLGPFVNDPTLRAGDVVVTSKGLMVFRGAGGHTHSERDFVSLSNASGLVPGSRQMLISLESANRMGPQATASAETKPARSDAPEVVSAADLKSTPAAR
ncbi:MAG: hypothetical protein NVSMB26_10310 [Beijerinckiaceae bacterium]